MKSYIVCYTLKHNTKPDTFLESYSIFNPDECETPYLDAFTFYNGLVAESWPGFNWKEWYLWHAAVTEVVDSTEQ